MAKPKDAVQDAKFYCYRTGCGQSTRGEFMVWEEDVNPLYTWSFTFDVPTFKMVIVNCDS